MNKKSKTVIPAYLGIIFVVLIWGLSPTAKKALIGDRYSASIYSTITSLAGACALLAISAKRLMELNRGYFKIALPTGLCISVAAFLQAIAYNFDASPTNQAFLENLSCIAVPVILFFAIKKHPTLLTVLASIFCLLSSMVLAGVFSDGGKFHTVDILNALAGIFYGINIAVTGMSARKYVPQLYVMIQLFVQTFFSAVMAVVFNFMSIGGSSVDPFVFTGDLWLILAVVLIGIVTKAVCWTVRTNAMKHVSATVVAIIMPLSAVVTGVVAVALGQDSLSWSLIVGAVLGLAASFMSGIGDVREKAMAAKAEK